MRIMRGQHGKLTYKIEVDSINAIDPKLLHSAVLHIVDESFMCKPEEVNANINGTVVPLDVTMDSDVLAGWRVTVWIDGVAHYKDIAATVIQPIGH